MKSKTLPQKETYILFSSENLAYSKQIEQNILTLNVGVGWHCNVLRMNSGTWKLLKFMENIYNLLSQLITRNSHKKKTHTHTHTLQKTPLCDQENFHVWSTTVKEHKSKTFMKSKKAQIKIFHEQSTTVMECKMRMLIKKKEVIRFILSWMSRAVQRIWHWRRGK